MPLMIYFSSAHMLGFNISVNPSCRHWFFKGDIVVDGEKKPENLMSIVSAPWKQNPNNSVVAFKDNSSALRGTTVQPVLPSNPGSPSPLMPQTRDWDALLTAETHNFPSAVAPFPGKSQLTALRIILVLHAAYDSYFLARPGAETGAGGRIRDTHATGKGSIMGAATAGYTVGNLQLDDYKLPWEDGDFLYPESLASPTQILIDASNGASDYGNKFGEPLIAGFTRTFGDRMPDGSRREWIKPIMFR